MLPVLIVLRAARVTFRSPSSTGFLSRRLTDDFWLGCSHTRYGSHSCTAAVILWENMYGMAEEDKTTDP